MSNAAPAVTEVLDVLVVGAGFAGLYQLENLRSRGYSVKVVEAGEGLGGIWHWNRYPGARVDSEGPIYQFTRPDLWDEFAFSELYPGGDELRRYFKYVDAKLDLSKDIYYNTRVASAEFDETANTWTVTAENGSAFVCKYFVLCTGFAAKPIFPKLAGMDSFAGINHHTGLWPEGGIDFAGKRIAIIGTGASGVQVAQEASKEAAQLTIFQRTPVQALPMRQRQLTDEDNAKIKSDLADRFSRRSASFSGFDFDFIPKSALEVSDEERTTTYERLWEYGFEFWLGTYQDVFVDHRQINALFFHNQQLITDTGAHGEHVKMLLNEEQRNQWIPEALCSVTSTNLEMLSTKWHQLGRGDIYSFESEFLSGDGSVNKKFLFKLFGPNSTSLAEQELTLLQNVPEIPTPVFLGRTKVENLICHVFEFNDYRKLAHREIGNGVITINKNLLSIDPPESLIKRFARSHQYLEQRISYETIENLRIVATTEQLPSLERFTDQYDFLIETLASLPRQIISQDTTSDTLLLGESGNTFVSHWASWKMEPIGSNWPIGERSKLEEAVGEVKLRRSSLNDTPTAAVVLCALTYAFERLCHRANYSDAIALLPDILEQLALVKTFSIEQRQTL